MLRERDRAPCPVGGRVSAGPNFATSCCDEELRRSVSGRTRKKCGQNRTKADKTGHIRIWTVSDPADAAGDRRTHRKPTPTGPEWSDEAAPGHASGRNFPGE